MRFVLIAIGLYIFWFLLYDLYLHPQRTFDLWVIDKIVAHTGIFLGWLGFEAQFPDIYGNSIRTIGVVDSPVVWIGDPCNGITLFALFTGFVIAFPGPLKTKLWFIPFGVITIHLLNVIRVAALALVAHYNIEYLEFNHTYTFTVLVYSYVFLLWYLWANKLSGIGSKN